MNTNNLPQDIDEYIASFPKETQDLLTKIRTIIQQSAPEATETMSYRMPTFVLHGNLVHFAAYKNHIGFYPTPSGIDAFKNELAGFANAKGSVQFPLNRALPFDTIAKIVKFRVAENIAKAEIKVKAKK